MRRIIVVLTVVALMAAMLAVNALPASLGVLGLVNASVGSGSVNITTPTITVDP